MDWEQFKRRLLGFLGATLTSRKVALAAAVSYWMWLEDQVKLVPLIWLAVIAGIAIEDAAQKLGIPMPFTLQETPDEEAEE